MFETTDMARMNNPLSLLGNEDHLWSHVSLRIHIPWFYIIFSMDYDDGSKRREMVFVTNINDLINMSRQSSIKVEQAYIVSPGHLNKREKWLMEPLSHVLAGLEPVHDQYAHVYIVENGDRYIDSGLGSREEELRDVKKIYTSLDHD